MYIMKKSMFAVAAALALCACSAADNDAQLREEPTVEVRLTIDNRIAEHGDFDSAGVPAILTEGVLVSSEEYCFFGDKQMYGNLLEWTGNQPEVLIFRPDGTGCKCWEDEPMMYGGEWFYIDFEWSYDVGTCELTTLLYGTKRYVATVHAVDDDGVILDGFMCEKPFMSGLETQDYFLRYAMDRHDTSLRDSYLSLCRPAADFE